mmetsp:Transcript_66808/g.204533  ORF Transcript_66808/g.204533 Transcript_66808/m.204533 type:complete len:204 (-) Transcript_66808:1229-1840(-)
MVGDWGRRGLPDHCAVFGHGLGLSCLGRFQSGGLELSDIWGRDGRLGRDAAGGLRVRSARPRVFNVAHVHVRILGSEGAQVLCHGRGEELAQESLALLAGIACGVLPQQLDVCVDLRPLVVTHALRRGSENGLDVAPRRLVDPADHDLNHVLPRLVRRAGELADRPMARTRWLARLQVPLVLAHRSALPHPRGAEVRHLGHEG